MSNQIEISSPSKPIYSKTNPFVSKITNRKILSSTSSSKATYHISLSIDETVDFKPGDSIGIYPENNLVDIRLLLNQALLIEQPNEAQLKELQKKNLQLVTSKFCKFVSNHLEPITIEKLEKSLETEDYLKSHDIHSFLETYKNVKPFDIQELISNLAPMSPRFYSIASSLSKHKSELHLLVGTFSYSHRGRNITGLGSSFLCHHAKDEVTSIPFFIHPSRNFALPTNPSTPIIMIGPGTGVAPFKAFLEERYYQGATENWLFFGERNRSCDFYYEEDFSYFQKNGYLKLSLAFSRDQEQKIYVQHLIQSEIDLFYDWLSRGAVIYVCGDAKNMAKDVQNTICSVLCQKENLSEEQGLEKFKELKKTQKIIFEVY